MAFIDVYNAANDATFQGRCMAAMWKIARAITLEADTVPDHDIRLAWALKTLRDKTTSTQRAIAIQALRSAAIAANPSAATDAEIETQLTSVVSDLIVMG